MGIKFTVLGEPRGKGRPRFRNAGNFVSTYTDKETASYENLVKLEYRSQCKDFMFPEDAELDARIYCYYTIPKSVSKKKRQMMIDKQIRPRKKPDCDNVVKIILDSLNNIAYKDDTQVVDCQVRKFYSETPKVVITIEEVTPIKKEASQ